MGWLGPSRTHSQGIWEGANLAALRQLGISAYGLASTIALLGACVSAIPATAEPWAPTAVEQRYLTDVDQYLTRPRPPDPFVLQLGYQACQVRRGGGSSDEAKVAVWKTWASSGLGLPSGAVVGSLIHVAVDNLCPRGRLPMTTER